MTCGLAYYLARVLKVSKTPAAWLIQGTAVHEAVSFWELSSRWASRKAVLDVYHKSWNESEAQAWKQEPNPAAWQKSGMKKTEKDLSDRLTRGEDQVDSYMEVAHEDPLEVWTLPDTGLPASEVPFLEDFGGVPVKGYIDLIMQDPGTGALLVRDLKTGTKKPVGSFQLATYRFAVHKKYGVDPLWGDYWMAKDGKPTSPMPIGEVPEAQITSQFQIMDITEKAGLYGANVGDHCGRCDVARHCPYVGGKAPEGIPALGT